MRTFIEKIIEFCARNKFIVFILVIAAVLAGALALKSLPLDALPDLSDTQVIIYSRWDRSPDILEDQVTYPIVTALLGAPKVKAIRGFSDFGYSYVYVIFQDGTDIYWARSRVLEYLSKITSRLPDGVRTELGPDATGVGWVFQYALVDETGQNSLADLRTFQDWYLRYYLQSVPGVAEVATVGGFVRQYQVNIDPNKLLIYNIPITEVAEAIRKGNNDVGGRLLEFSGTEYMVRGRGYAKSVKDLEEIVVGVDAKSGTPILIKHIANVSLGPDIRRGVAELDGKGDCVGGIVVMRHGESALEVIKRVKEKLKEIEPSLPKGVKIVTAYDRTDLIKKSIDTISEVLIEDFLIVAVMIIFFLLHIPSAMMPILLLPAAALIAFIPMLGMRLTVNIMSIMGIVLAIGDMVDVGVVLVENVHSKLCDLREGKINGERAQVMIEAMKEVGAPIFSSLMVTVIGFLPLFSLVGQEGRLFRPMAATQIFSVFFGAVLSITLVPALIMIFLRKTKPRALDEHFASRFLAKCHKKVLAWAFRSRKVVVLILIAVLAVTVPVFLKLGSEFMPPLYEGSILYMPTTLPGLSVTEASKLLQAQDKILKSFPEVERVFGKAGRAETSTDPAPFSMMETTVILKPREEWRKVPLFGKSFPAFKRPMSFEELTAEMDDHMQFPGTTNAWTMPIKARIDMLTTGVRTPVGIKIFGSDLKEIEKVGEHLEMVLKDVPGTRSIYAERTAGGYFVDFDLKRQQLARYGLSIEEAEMVIMSAVGGENITTIIEGRERYPVNLRYARELRDDLDKLRRVLVPTKSGAQVPLEQLADIKVSLGPAMIRNENGMLSGYVYVDMAGRDIGSYVRDAKKAVREKVQLPAGYSLSWSGQYEYMERVKKRLGIFIPATLLIIFLLYYFNFKSVVSTVFIMLAMPFTAIGAAWSIRLLGFNKSIAVYAGMMEVIGIGAALCALVITFITVAYDKRKNEGKIKAKEDIYAAISEGASRALRPAMMTCSADILGLMPAMWASGIGGEFLKRYTAPIIFGLFTALILSLIVIPVFYVIWKVDFAKRDTDG
ncbi:MAG: cation transporter [Omnitrophica WOR_2 bacterium GWF2_43_52]|nr:MAG: cation transporter [Omnitrophica WOR_2 bacterium GWF2_43_52]HBG64124.1 CusA/CzcA family heavy metal efflux RND transporter [Candidatus Omnitrophota bacterium]